MMLNYFYLLLLAFIACQIATAQNEDDLQIPVENDNQFPPDNHSDVIEGSGEGVIDEPQTETTEAPPIEHIESRLLSEDDEETPVTGVNAPVTGDDDVCPKPCVCRVEGTTNDFVIDCSGYGLTEFPSPLNEKATILNIQKNKIVEIPNSISMLKNLKILKASDNEIMTIVPGSISELPELVTLELRNNRLIDYPNDLKNSFGQLKLQDLDLGGNDMRTTLTADLFSKFESLRKITLPTSTPDLQQDLCSVLSKSLLKVCTKSCEHDTYDCKEEDFDGEDLPVLPGMIAVDNNDDESVFDNQENRKVDSNPQQETSSVSSTEDNTPKVSGKITAAEFSFRSAINKQPEDVQPSNSINENPDKPPSTTEVAVKVGATTDTKTGGVNKTIIGLVVVGMVVIVAVITIKKNWNSIAKRFGSNSNSRTPNQQTGGNANGSAPEEVPLQDKSPV
ncbi:unnamed protein product [Diatraea saccharalis]|uniref:LRRNT domain-containing protein n=1 Tax=Diatraea saccharalis TaxID=40085 RepID=A0A9N9QZJ2_9NEOP|nr:unnamed protein product [Diatraea saccharalis]